MCLYSQQSVSDALDRALDYFNERKPWWTELQQSVMRIDFSWDAAPVDQYIDLYERAVDKAHNATFTPIVWDDKGFNHCDIPFDTRGGWLAGIPPRLGK